MASSDGNPDLTNTSREQTDQDLFNKIAAKYARKDIVKSTKVCRKYQLFCVVKPFIKSQAKINTLVDIACGIAAPAKYLDEYYTNYIGVDYSQQMIEIAKDFHKINSNARFVCSNIKDLDLGDSKADVILAIGALHHMTNLEEVFSSLKKVAKPGAAFVALEPQAANPVVQLLRWFRSIIDKVYSKEQIYFSKKDLHKILSDNGLTDIETKYQGFFTPPFAQVVLNPQLIFYPLGEIAILLDKFIDYVFPEFLKIISWNVIIRARFPK